VRGGSHFWQTFIQPPNEAIVVAADPENQPTPKLFSAVAFQENTPTLSRSVYRWRRAECDAFGLINRFLEAGTGCAGSSSAIFLYRRFSLETSAIFLYHRLLSRRGRLHASVNENSGIQVF
jgi:hypothetical protein